jgi:hypothetical protein
LSTEPRPSYLEHGSDDEQSASGGGGVGSPASAAASVSSACGSGTASNAQQRLSIHSPAYVDKQTELREPQLHHPIATHHEAAGSYGLGDASMANHATFSSMHSANAEAAKDRALVESMRSELTEKDHTIAEMKETIQVTAMTEPSCVGARILRLTSLFVL